VVVDITQRLAGEQCKCGTSPTMMWRNEQAARSRPPCISALREPSQLPRVDRRRGAFSAPNLDRAQREKASATQILERAARLEVQATRRTDVSVDGCALRAIPCTRRWPTLTSTSSPRSIAR